MTSISSQHKKFVLVIQIIALVVSLSYGQGPRTGANQVSRLSNNGSALCPKGWSLAAYSNNGPPLASKKLCLRVVEQLQSWDRSRRECRRGKGFLVKMDSALTVNSKKLADYLKLKGVDSVWTGMHHKYRKLLWDELNPHMVKAYHGQAEKYGWNKRGWKLDADSFKLGNDTCGKFQIGSRGNSLPGNNANRRTKRSAPTQRSAIARTRSPLTGDGRRQGSRLDSDDVHPSRSPGDEKRTETSPNFWNNHAVQDSNVDTSDPSNGGDQNTGGKMDTSRRSRLPLLGTTTSSTTTTDQSNLEDSDDNLLTTARSTSLSNTTDSSSITTAFNSSSSTTTSKMMSGETVKTTPLSTSTTSPLQSSTSNDDNVNFLLEPPLPSSSTKDMSSLDGSAPDESFDPIVLAQTKIPQAISERGRTLETQAIGTDSRESTHSQLLRINTTLNPLNSRRKTKTTVSNILTSLLESRSDEIAKLFNFSFSTSTAQPESMFNLPFILPTGTQTRNEPNTSPNPHWASQSLDNSRDTTISVLKLTSTGEGNNFLKDFLTGGDNFPSINSHKESETTEAPVTPKYVPENIISTGFTTTTRLPTAAENALPQSKETKRLDQMTAQPAETDTFKAFLNSMFTDRPTTTDSISTAQANTDTTSGTTTSTQINANVLTVSSGTSPSSDPASTSTSTQSSASDTMTTTSTSPSDTTTSTTTTTTIPTTTATVTTTTSTTPTATITSTITSTSLPLSTSATTAAAASSLETPQSAYLAPDTTTSTIPQQTLNTTAQGNDDSGEITTKSQPPDIISTTSPSSNLTETLTIRDSQPQDIDLNHSIINTNTSRSNKRLAKFSNMTMKSYKQDSSEAFDSVEILDSSLNTSDASTGRQENFDAILRMKGGLVSSARASNDGDSSETSGGKSNNSSRNEANDSQENDKFINDELNRNKEASEPISTISLSRCDEEYASVCITEAIEELTLVGHCDRNWYGHRLLDRCYKPVEYTLKAIDAKQTCLRYSASLATVDTDFYGNITAMILSFFVSGSRVWVDASLNLGLTTDGQCTALENGQLFTVDCNMRLPFICQKEAHIFAPYNEDQSESEVSVTYVQNMTSFYPQSLWCPLRMAAFDDVILWFKDGRPIINQEDGMDTFFGQQNGNVPNRLDLSLSILERIGDGGARILKPAMLQGVYWCEIWRREPFHKVISHKIFLKFTDVITLYGQITTQPTSYLTAAQFNRMGHVAGLPALMERRLSMMNRNITHQMRSFQPIVRDIVTFITSTDPITGRSEFTTYICVPTGDLRPSMRGSLADLYLSTFYESLVKAEADLRKEWNLTQPIRHAVSVSMADMCPEVTLVDLLTGLNATFPSTSVNSSAASRNICNGIPTGSAFCKGDLQTGAYWDSWRVVNPCYIGRPTAPTQETNKQTSNSSLETANNETGTDNSPTLGVGGSPSNKPPNTGLAELNDVQVQPGNVADVTNRLVEALNDKHELSAAEIGKIVHVVNKIVSVDSPPSQISEKLIHTANKVLEAPEAEIMKAERQSQAPSRLLSDLETFGGKVDMGEDPRVRFVTPNVAMELWSLDDSNDVVIGFGATQTFSWSAPLSEPRIQTIKDREWADQHLSDFDIAIELPESLVKNTVRYSDSSLRLSMFIYRKTGLFVQGKETEATTGTVNSAIISASLGGQRIRGLQDKVRLVFKPFQEQRDNDTPPRCVFWDTESEGHARWSRSGCVYNGTLNRRHVCLCDHLTNFAILTDYYGDEVPIPVGHETALTVLTIIGLILSIIGLSATIITFIAFKKLRQGRAQQTLFNMAVALLCFQIIFLVGVKQTSIMPVCLSVAVLLHYFILVSFAWMLIEAVLQYLTFVKVLGTYISHYTIKTVLPAWGVPLLPVIAVLATDYKLYLGRINYCWMSLQAFYYAFALPVGIIIVFNIVMFFVIVVSIASRPNNLRSNQSSSKTRETSLRAAFTIFILLGLTWIFGYLAIEDARLPFQYAFTILSSLQGFLIFVLMVARRRQVREQWEAACCLRLKNKAKKKKKQKQLSPTFSNSSTSSHSMPSFSNQTYTSDSIILSSSTNLRRQASLNV